LIQELNFYSTDLRLKAECEVEVLGASQFTEYPSDIMAIRHITLISNAGKKIKAGKNFLAIYKPLGIVYISLWYFNMMPKSDSL
jgi:hypothetical protein